MSSVAKLSCFGDPRLVLLDGVRETDEKQIRKEDKAGTPHIDSQGTQGCCSRHASATTNHLDGSLPAPATSLWPATPCDLGTSNDAARRTTAR